MAKESYKNKEAASTAQTSQTEAVVTAKAELTKYLKKNKLERDGDYSKDKKHGKSLKALNLAIEKENEKLVEINKIVDSFKDAKSAKGSKKVKGEKAASKGAKTVYEYPEGLTSEEKKKWRVAARKGVTDPKELLKTAKAEKVEKVKKEKAPKAEKAEKAPKAEKSTKEDKKAKKSAKAEKPAKEAKTSKTDKKAKKTKKSND